jgi:leader peptidase (prepilin peptidase)/N-methyltransferase
MYERRKRFHTVLQRFDWIDFSILALIFIPIVIFDLSEKRIPDLFVLPGIGIFLVKRIAEKRLPISMIFITAAAGFVFIFLLSILSKGKIGVGDAKLSALVALALGLKGWMAAVFIASFTGVLFALVMIALRKMTWKTRLPFAPFLALGSLAPFFLKDLSFFSWLNLL